MSLIDVDGSLTSLHQESMAVAVSHLTGANDAPRLTDVSDLATEPTQRAKIACPGVGIPGDGMDMSIRWSAKRRQ